MSFGLLILLVSILLQFAAAAVALWLIKLTGWKAAWILFSSALVLMGLRRSITFANAFPDDAEHIVHVSTELLALAISLLMLLGVLLIRSNFQSLSEAERTLHRSESKFRRFFESSQVSIWNEDFSEVYKSLKVLRESGVTDLRKYFQENKHAALDMAKTIKVNEVNEATLRLFQADSEDAFIHSIDQVFGAGSTKVFTDELCAIWENDQTFHAEAKHNTLDGKELSVIVSMPVPTTEDEFSNVPISIIDVTQQKRLEEELKKLERLESIGTLAGGIAHDFNNILTGLFGNISLAREELTQNHPAAQFLDGAQISLSRANGLTRQLLTFAKGGEPVKETVNITELVSEIVRFDLFGSNVKPIIEPPDAELAIDVDKGQIQQVLSNLTINAGQAMPEGGSLYIKVELINYSDGVPQDLTQANYVKITFRDEGSGIDQRDIERIFEPYFSTKQTGSGLGLAATYSVIARHRGHINVESELGKGSTFTLYLPGGVFLDRSADLAPVPQVRTFANQRAPRILIMDDEEMILGVARSVLQRMGCSVETALDGKRAVEEYAKSMGTTQAFDCVIMDLTVPGGQGGKEAMEEILEIDPGAIAIVSSGYTDDAVMANYTDFGFKGVITKPYTLDELEGVVYNVIGVEDLFKERSLQMVNTGLSAEDAEATRLAMKSMWTD